MKGSSEMNSVFVKVICAAITAAILAGCTQAPANGPENNASAAPVPANISAVTSEGAPDDAFYDSTADFAADLLITACKSDISSGNNVLISPESVLMALAMAANGAKGETEEQMLATLCGGIDIDTLNNDMLYLAERAKSSENVTFNAANSVWARDAEGFTLSQPFVDKAKSYYNADCFVEPFDKETADKINDWVNSQTDGMIPSIIDEIKDEDMTFLINAIAFEGEWMNEYRPSSIDENARFTNSAGKTEDAVMLQSGEHVYMHDDDCEAFLKYYQGGEYAFMGILPDKDMTLSDFAEKFDGSKLRGLWESRLYGQDVTVFMPEFTYKYDVSLASSLSDMGMKLPFTHEADFSGMSDSEELYIDGVMHETFISVDRKGTKAAAVTAITVAAAAALNEKEPVIIRLDRPFMYAIVDTVTGFPVFIGAVNSVAQQ